MSAKTNKASVAGLLVAMGIVYGDIGTSPLYVMKGLIHGNGGQVSETFLLGSVSLIIWTLTILTTVKYVMLALNADNNGEGGIFSLYTLIRHMKKWLIIPAMIGGAALLADGVLTPAVTVTSAIEGLRTLPIFTDAVGYSQTPVIIITLTIIAILFLFQRFGTEKVGKLFGPVMFGWFTFLLISGVANLMSDVTILRAINPMYAIKLLVSPENKLGLLVLGNIFLATTGAEALYSDMGHVGKQNIRISWPYVKIALIMNYFGQVAYMLHADITSFEEMNPFFHMISDPLMPLAVGFATLAAIIASQALITGSFTLVSEAMKLKLLPRLRIFYPGSSREQQYIPVVNFILWAATSLVVLGFRTSEKMEAAYGLSITVTMLMTTVLLYFYLIQIKRPRWQAMGISLFFGVIEVIFLWSSLAKFMHGGYVAVFIALIIGGIMFIWYKGNAITSRLTQTLHVRDYLPQLEELHDDTSYPLLQSNVVYLTKVMEEDEIEAPILYSILDKKPKRALVYWFVNIEVTDQPYTKTYEINQLSKHVVLVKFKLGFRISQDVNIYLRQIVTDLMASGEIDKQPQKYSVDDERQVGDFRFVLLDEGLSAYSGLKGAQKQLLHFKFAIRRLAVSPARWFGLEFSDVLVERVPIIIESNKGEHLMRVAEVD